MENNTTPQGTDWNLRAEDSETRTPLWDLCKQLVDFHKYKTDLINLEVGHTKWYTVNI